jgi:hypothetical protein
MTLPEDQYKKQDAQQNTKGHIENPQECCISGACEDFKYIHLVMFLSGVYYSKINTRSQVL